MAASGDVIPEAINYLYDEVDRAIADIAMSGAISKYTGIVNTLAKLVRRDVPSTNRESYITFLNSCRNGWIAGAADAILVGLAVNSLAVSLAEGRLNEPNLPQMINGASPLKQTNQLRAQYDAAKEFIPDLDSVNDKDLNAGAIIGMMFDKLMSDFYSIRPGSTSRWKLSKGKPKFPARFTGVIAANNANGGHTVLELDNKTFTTDIYRDGTGATALAAIAATNLAVPRSDQIMTFHPQAPVIGAARQFIDNAAAAQNLLSTAPSATPTTAPVVAVERQINGVWTAVQTVTLSYTEARTITFRAGDRLMFSFAAGLLTSATNSAADTFIRYEWDLSYSVDTGRNITVKSAIVDIENWKGYAPGLGLNVIELISKFLVKKGATGSIFSLIRLDYAAEAGSNDLATVSDSELSTLQWWTSADARVSSRNTLGEVYERLYDFVYFHLNFLATSVEFIDYLYGK